MKLTASQLLTGTLLVGALGATAYLGLSPGGGLFPSATTQRPGARPQATAKGSLPGQRPGALSARATASAGVEEVFRAGWGSGPGELGHVLPQEASPEGPMSFAVDRDGRAFVLDQVNARVAVFGRGEAPRSFSLPVNTYQDIALDRRGGLAVLDRLVTRAIAFLSPAGEVRHQIALEGKGVPEGGSVTALFARDDGFWVEVDHASLVRVAHADGSPDEDRPSVPGRFDAQAERFVLARLEPDGAAVLARAGRDGLAKPFARATFAAGVLQLSALEVDAQGRVFVAASLATEEDGPDFALRGEGDQVVAFSPEGAEIGRALFPDNEGPEEQVTRVRIGDDGAIYHLGLGKEGATMRRYVP